FSAKDGVDITSCAISSMYAFLKSLSGESWKVEEEDFMVEMIYSSALIVRERAPQLSRLNRTVSMLSVVSAEVEMDKKKIDKSIKTLFGEAFTGLQVQPYSP
nr:hypothetical protein [bacterium]